jgi:predicted GNAT family N-acyltransferase
VSAGPDEAELTLRVGDWPSLRQGAESVRRAVFVVEQGLPEADEFDDDDPRSVHAVAFDGDRAVATGRLLPGARIGRMAVLAPYRRSGVGGRILARLIEVAAARGDTELVLSSQAYVRAFYVRHGFVAEGGLYDDAGIPHQTMRRRLG